jgi:serine/threonine protein kinase
MSEEPRRPSQPHPVAPAPGGGGGAPGDEAVAAGGALASAGAAAPEEYGPYLLLERIGKGGMAEVFRAVKRGPENFVRMFALKRIIPQHAESTDFVDMFCTEARVSALLNHPNIVQVYDFGEAQGSYYLAMEYLKGKTILAVLRTLHARRAPFPMTSAAYIGRQVALGLEYAHALKGQDGKPLRLVHRDINPSNVMLLKSGGVKILDFGIAKVPSLARTHTQAGYVKGKLSYSSPEQLKCKPLDGRSDVFSLGVMLWEMLTMQKLFGGKKDYDTVTNVMNKPLVPPSRHRDEVPAALDEIVMAALSRSPADRPEAKEVAARLGQYLRNAHYLEDGLVELLRELFGAQTSQVFSIGAGAAFAGNPDPQNQTQVMSQAELARLMGDPAGERSSKMRSPIEVAADGDRDPQVVGTTPDTGLLEADPGWPDPFAPAAASPAPPPVAEVPEVVPSSRRSDTRYPTPPAVSPDGPRPRRHVHVPTPLIAAAGVAGLALMLSANWSAFREMAALVAAQGGSRGDPGGGASESLEVTVELDSKPRGAAVERSDGKVVGVTPLLLRLPRSSVPVSFLMKKDGHEPFRYEILPLRDSIATIELRAAVKR